MYRRLDGLHGRSGRVRKISPPPGFDPQTVQPVASRYTDIATRPVSWITKATNTHSQYAILNAFPLQQWLHERTSLLRYSTLPVLLRSRVVTLLQFIPWTYFKTTTITCRSRHGFPTYLSLADSLALFHPYTPTSNYIKYAHNNNFIIHTFRLVVEPSTGTQNTILNLAQYLTNLTHKICFTLSFISSLYMFRAHVLISSGGQNCITQPLVSSNL